MSKEGKIWFVCLHGSAKSLIASKMGEHLAQKTGMSGIRFGHAGTEADAKVPPHVVQGLKDDGIDVSGEKPNAASAALLSDATHVVSFGPDIRTLAPPGAKVEYWKDVPNVADGYESAREAIVRKVESLLDGLGS